MTTTLAAKDMVQKEARAAFKAANYWGSFYMATGSGKSKIAVDESKTVILDYITSKETRDEPKILVVVPTEKLRDLGWKNEFDKWTNNTEVWNTFITSTCYASLDTFEDQNWDLVILDEGHHITNNNSVFFKKNRVKRCMLMTATKPTNKVKQDILKELNLLSPCYELPLDRAVDLGIVAPYEITVIHMELDSVNKNIRVDYKDKKTHQPKVFFQTERERYNYLSKMVSFSENPMAVMNRMNFLKSLPRKTEVARAIVDNVLPQDARTMIFCGTKAQANRLCQFRYYSKPTKPKEVVKPTGKKLEKYAKDFLEYQNMLKEYQGDTSYNMFCNKEINWLACVEALNEGENIEGLDVGFIVQCNAQSKDLVQRMGRILRVREGHTGKIIILCIDGTQDEEWVYKASMSLNKANITHVKLADLRTGAVTISFD